MKRARFDFDGARLREAREARGISAIALSDIAEVTRQSINAYETGRVTPSPEVFDRIASQLNFPTHFFLQSPRESVQGTVFYRSMASATRNARTRTEHRFEWLHDVVRYLSEYVAFPKANFPVLGLAADPLQIAAAEIEQAAETVRRDWGLRDEPIANMISLLEHQGAIVSRGPLEAESLESLSEFSPTLHRPFILIGTDKGTAVRWRFDAAHELGHLVLHSHVSPEILRRPELHKLIESQAHQFAGAFLLPCAAFGDELYGTNLDHFLALKARWKVSVAAMIKRARQCDLIDADQERLLWIKLSRRGWRTEEPFDGPMKVEEPRLLRSAFELLLEKAAVSPDEILDDLALRAIDVESLCGLPEDFFSSYSQVSLRPSQVDTETPMDATPAQVIQLRPLRRHV